MNKRELMEISVLRSSLAWPKMIFDLVYELSEDDFEIDLCRSLHLGIQKSIENRMILYYDPMTEPLLESELISDNVKQYLRTNISPKKGDIIDILTYLSQDPTDKLSQFKLIASQYYKKLLKADPNARVPPITVRIDEDGNISYSREDN
jgi:hypothetical protein